MDIETYNPADDVKERKSHLCKRLKAVEESLRGGIKYSKAMMTNADGVDEEVEVCIMTKGIVEETADYLFRSRKCIEYLKEEVKTAKAKPKRVKKETVKNG